MGSQAAKRDSRLPLRADTVVTQEIPVWVSGRLIGVLQTAHDGSSRLMYEPDIPETLVVSVTRPVRVFEKALPRASPWTPGLPAFCQAILPTLFPSAPPGYAARAGWVERDERSVLLRMGRTAPGRVSYGGDYQEDPNWQQRLIRAFRSTTPHAALRATVQERIAQGGLSAVSPYGKLAGLMDAWDSEDVCMLIDPHALAGRSYVSYIGLEACRAAGLDVPETCLSGDGRALMLKRWDRAEGWRLGSEGAGVLCERSPFDRYQGSTKDLLQMVALYIPEEDQHAARMALWDRLVCFDVLRHGDAHMQSWGIIYEHPQHASLAPVLAVSTTPVFLPSDRPALPGLSGSTPAWLTPESLMELSARCGLTRPFAENRYRLLRDALLETVDMLTHRILLHHPAAEGVTQRLRHTVLDSPSLCPPPTMKGAEWRHRPPLRLGVASSDTPSPT